MELIKEYLKYLILAKNRHGIHSPFVYNFIDSHLYKPVDPLIVSEIEGVRKALLKDNSEIDFIDLGAGSKKGKVDKPRVKDIAKNSLKPTKYAKLIANLGQYINAKSVIELGTSFGTTTLYLSRTLKNAKIHSIEGCDSIARVAKSNFDQLGVKNINLIIGNFNTEFPKLLDKLDFVDLIYIDGNHTYEATLSYFNLAIKKIDSKGIIVFDDIFWSKGMKQAWLEIKNHPDVTISFDFFYIGVISIDSRFSKESFRIRY